MSEQTMDKEARKASAPDNSPKVKKPLMQKLAGNPAVRIGLGGAVATVGGYGLYQVPAIHQGVDTLLSGVSDYWKSLTGQESPEKLFPIKLDQSSFTPVSAAEEEDLWKNTKTVDLDNHTFTIGFPVDQETIDQSPNLRMNAYFEPKLYSGGVDVAKLEKEGIKNVVQLSGLPKDYKACYKYDQTKFQVSAIPIGIAKGIDGQDSSASEYTAFRLLIKNRQTGKNFETNIEGLYAKPLIKLVPYPNHHPVYEDGTPIDPDTPIFQLTTDLQDAKGVVPGERGQVVFQAIYAGNDADGIIELTQIFLKTAEGSFATTK